MEPQLEGCGKTVRAVINENLGLLQWSRNLRVAERAAIREAMFHDKELQWSRNLRVAERIALLCHEHGLSSFNGAAT